MYDISWSLHGTEKDSSYSDDDDDGAEEYRQEMYSTILEKYQDTLGDLDTTWKPTTDEICDVIESGFEESFWDGFECNHYENYDEETEFQESWNPQDRYQALIQSYEDIIRTQVDDRGYLGDNEEDDDLEERLLDPPYLRHTPEPAYDEAGPPDLEEEYRPPNNWEEEEYFADYEDDTISQAELKFFASLEDSKTESMPELRNGGERVTPVISCRDNHHLITTTFHGRLYLAQLDPGADTSLIGPELALSAELLQLPSINLDMEIDGIIKELELQPEPDLEYDFLLGIDFCQIWKVQIDFGAKRWRSEVGKWFPFCTTDQQDCPDIKIGCAATPEPAEEKPVIMKELYFEVVSRNSSQDEMNLSQPHLTLRKKMSKQNHRMNDHEPPRYLLLGGEGSSLSRILTTPGMPSATRRCGTRPKER